ncbi:MAG: tandem-95 repeat protein [Bradymonadales bacterium]|nr:tandem-95 repeat protein [Bradymonadales bacterium]
MGRKPSTIYPLVLLALTVTCSCGDDGADGSLEDSAAPTIIVTSPATSLTSEYTLTGTVSDNVGVLLLSYRLNQDPGAFTLPVAPSFQVDLRLAFGANTIRLEAVDAAGNIGSVEHQVQVNTPVAPVAMSSALVVDEDVPTEITLEAHDANEDPLAFEIVDPPVQGQLTGTPPEVTYTGHPDLHGSDSFTFRASDGTFESNLATISLTVRPVNDAPVATGQEGITTAEDTPVVILLAGTDIEGDELTYHIDTEPAHGTLDTGALPQVTYLPDRDYHGSDQLAFSANDGLLESQPAVVSITITPVNDPPVAVSSAVIVNEDNSTSFRLEATDVDGDPLVYTITAMPASGTLSTSTLPLVTYTPAANYIGLDSLSFLVDDGEYQDSATVTIQVVEGSTIYVSQGGNDANDGLSPLRPKRSIAAAIAAADIVGPDEMPDTIRVDLGRYCTAGLVIDRSLEIVGAGSDLTVLDGRSTSIDCVGAPLDTAVTMAQICAQRPGKGWPTGGVVTVLGDGAAPIEVSLSNLSIANGYSESAGGGIENYERLTLQRVSVEANCATLGGGIYNRRPVDLPEGSEDLEWGSLLLIDSTVSLNGAETGGGVYNQGWVRISGTTIEKNEAFLVDLEAIPAEGEYPGWGGGLFSQAEDPEQEEKLLVVTVSIVDSNKAWQGGAGIVSIGQEIEIVDSSISRNSAGTDLVAGSGGGLVAIGSDLERQELTITDSLFHLNSARGETGGILARNLDLVMIEGEVVGNSADEQAGMAIWGMDWGTGGSADLTTALISGSQIELNTAIGTCGGLFVDQVDLWMTGSRVNDNSAFTVGGVMFERSRATLDTSEVSRNQATSAAGMWVDEQADLLAMDTSILANLATRHSGGIYNVGRLTLDNCTLIHNEVRASEPDCNPAVTFLCDPPSVGMVQIGGAIRNDFGELNLVNRTRIDNNEVADVGAGLYVDGGTVRLELTTIAGNRAVNRNDDNGPLESGGDGGRLPEGGGIYLVEGQLDVVDSDISGNVAELSGGGLLNQGGEVTLTGTVLAANLAEAEMASGLIWQIQRGGGIYNLADLSVTDCYFLENQAADQGGGIYALGGSLFVDRTTFWVNEAASSIDPRDDLVGEGGALWISGIPVDIWNSTFSANLAEAGGAAILLADSASASLEYVTLYDNAPGDGHAALSGGTFSLYASIIASGDGYLSCGNAEVEADMTMASDTSCFVGSSGDATLFPNTDPMLDEIDFNWGFGLTHLPLTGSPVLDAIPAGACRDPADPTRQLEIDQRGFLRPVDGDLVAGALCDLGAVERQPIDSEEDDD